MEISDFRRAGKPSQDEAENLPAGAPDASGLFPASVPPGGHLAYLVNVYPKVSHSFIQTEIAALERLGLTVSRFTIRRTPESFSSEEDSAEAARTVSLLDGNLPGLASAVLRSFLRRPGASLRVLWKALRGTRNPVRALAYFAEAAALASFMQRSGIRHVHVHFGTNPVVVARLASRLAPITYSFTAHGPDEFDAPLALDLPGKIADAGFAVGVSSFGRSQLMRWSDPRHWDRIHVVRCAVAPRFLQQGGSAVYDDLSAVQARAQITCVARLSAQKGLPLLVEAAARVAHSHDFVIDVIGDGEGRPALEDMIRRLGLQDRVCLHGWRSPEDVREALSASRAFILPSFAEGLPVVLMEALALGKPVVTTSIAGIPELVDAANGWVVPSGSVDALAAAMKALLETGQDRLNEMGRIGQQRVRTMHDPDVNAGHLASLLAPLI